MTKSVLVPIFEGFEEIEAITVVDLLRRAGVEVLVVSLDKLQVRASRGIVVVADCLIGEIEGLDFDVVVLPGGPGVKNLYGNPILEELLRRQAASARLLAAICAAPTVLAHHGLLDGIRATCYPASEGMMKGAILARDSVVRDGGIVTSRGAGTAIDFALAIIEVIDGSEKSQEIANSIVYLPSKHG